jgi:hypothetical protein
MCFGASQISSEYRSRPVEAATASHGPLWTAERIERSTQRRDSTAFEAAQTLVAHRSPFRARQLLQTRAPARRAALTHRPIWPACRTVSPDPNKIPCRNLVSAQKGLSSPFGSAPSRCRVSGPRIVARVRREACRAYSRSVAASPSAGWAPRPPRRESSSPDGVPEAVRLRRPPANNRVTSEKASKQGAENEGPH